MKSVTLLSCLFVCASLLSACGKKDEGAPTVAASPEKKVKKAKSESSAPASAPAPAAAVPERQMSQLDALNLMVDQFGGYYGRTPHKIEELVEKRLIPRLPEPTPGKRFELVTDKKTRTARVIEVPN